MRHLGLALLLYAGAVAETALVCRMPLGAWSPRLLLLVAVVAATLGGPPGLVWAAAVGLVSDAVAPGGMGMGMFCTVVVVWAAGRWLRGHRADTVLARTVLTFAVVGAILLSATTVRLWLNGRPIDPVRLGTAVAGSAAASSLIVFIALIAGRLVRRVLLGSRAGWASESFSR